MKTISFKLLFFALLMTFTFAACQKDEANDLVPNVTTETLETVDNRNDENEIRRRPTVLPGAFHYEDGYCDVHVHGQWESHGLEDLQASFTVTDANSSIITFRSTDFRLLKRAVIYSADKQCYQKLIGQTYSDDFATYLRVDSQEIFNCIWSQNEEFDFKFKVYGYPL